MPTDLMTLFPLARPSEGLPRSGMPLVPGDGSEPEAGGHEPFAAFLAEGLDMEAEEGPMEALPASDDAETEGESATDLADRILSEEDLSASFGARPESRPATDPTPVDIDVPTEADDDAAETDDSAPFPSVAPRGQDRPAGGAPPPPVASPVADSDGLADAPRPGPSEAEGGTTVAKASPVPDDPRARTPGDAPPTAIPTGSMPPALPRPIVPEDPADEPATTLTNGALELETTELPPGTRDGTGAVAPGSSMATGTIPARSTAPSLAAPSLPEPSRSVSDANASAAIDPPAIDIQTSARAEGQTTRLEGGVSLTQLRPTVQQEIRALSTQLALSDGPSEPRNRTTEVELAPAELGRLKLTLHTTERGLHLTVFVDRPESLEQVRRHLEGFHRSLISEGVRLDSVDIGAGDRGPRDHGAATRPNAEASPQDDLGEAGISSPSPLATGRPSGDGRLDIRL